MEKYLFPWDSRVMIDHPWAFPVFLFVLSVLLSVISWIRTGK